MSRGNGKQSLDRNLDRQAMTALARRLPAAQAEPVTAKAKAKAAKRNELLRQKEEALNGIVARHWAALLAFALRCVRGRADRQDVAHDVLQQVFFVLWANVHKVRSFQLGRPLRPWLKRLVFCEVANHFRRRHDAQVADGAASGLTQPGPSALQELIDREEREYITALVARLPPLHAEVFQDRYLRDQTVADIAEKLRWPAGRVYAVLRECLRLLRQAGGLDLREKVQRAAGKLRRELARRWPQDQWADALHRLTTRVRNDEAQINRAWHVLSRLRQGVAAKEYASAAAVAAALDQLCAEVCHDDG